MDLGEEQWRREWISELLRGLKVRDIRLLYFLEKNLPFACPPPQLIELLSETGTDVDGIGLPFFVAHQQYPVELWH